MSDTTGRNHQFTSLELVASMKRMLASIDRQRQDQGPKPVGFVRPRYGTAEYHHACACGWIETEEAENDREAFLARSERAKRSYGVRTLSDPRLNRPAPAPSRQYVRPMATAVFRDDGLTGQAKATLAVILAFCGKGKCCDTTKSFLAQRMARSSRTILRYLTALARRGYIRTTARKNKRGMDIGLRIWITQAVLPFFTEDRALAEWIAETSAFPGRTSLSPNNDSPKSLSLSSLFLAQNPHQFVP